MDMYCTSKLKADMLRHKRTASPSQTSRQISPGLRYPRMSIALSQLCRRIAGGPLVEPNCYPLEKEKSVEWALISLAWLLLFQMMCVLQCGLFIP